MVFFKDFKKTRISQFFPFMEAQSGTMLLKMLYFYVKQELSFLVFSLDNGSTNGLPHLTGLAQAMLILASNSN